jgi:alkylation response protein AidB-like acyl-CoA dehydrogenase
MIDADERAVMEETVRGAIAAALATTDEGADIDAVLAKLGWLAMLADEPDDAIEIAFRALGAANATATALDDVVASALGQTPRADLAVLLPRFAAWDPPGRIDADDLDALGLATGRAATAAEILVVCGTASESWTVIVPTTAAEAQVVHGVDPDAGLQTVRVHGRASGAMHVDPAAWQSAVALGRRAIAHQIEAASRAMLDLARTHAMERVQFGCPIARFQAVRHRLAEALVAVEALAAALTAAREVPSPETAALAKAIAGRTAHTVARHCQQVLAGIGFTTEHLFHRFLKRVLALEGLFGSADEIVLDVGRRLLAERRVPTLIEL